MSVRFLLSLLDAEIAEREASDADGDETNCALDAAETQPEVNASE